MSNGDSSCEKCRTRSSALPLPAGHLALALVAVALFGAMGCESRPAPIASADFEPDAAEVDLWDASQEAFAFALRSGSLAEDAALDTYLQKVAHRLLPHLGAPSANVRISVVKYPYANAMAAPNGDIYLNTGLLVRIENEDQLATLLGHELAHFVRRHAYDRKRARAAAFHHPLDHARELEREADRLGFEAMAAAGYDTAQAQRLFEILVGAVEEADAQIRQRDQYGYSSHPRLSERIASYRALVATHADAGSRRSRDFEDTAARYEQRILPLLLQNVELDIESGRLSSARRGIDRYLEALPASADGYLLLGDWHSANLARRPDFEAAVAAFERAAELAPDSARAHRELGLLYRAEGRRDLARASLSRYLELAPDAGDRAIIETFIRTVGLPAVSAH